MVGTAKISIFALISVKFMGDDPFSPLMFICISYHSGHEDRVKAALWGHNLNWFLSFQHGAARALVPPQPPTDILCG